MKYSENNKPLVCMQTQSTCYRRTVEMEIKGILWKSTGLNNPNLKRYIQPSDDSIDKAKMLSILGENKYKNDWNHATRQAGMNCWIGTLADGSIASVQTMPWNYKPWGCGSGVKGSCNNGWIHIQICEDDLTNKDYFNKIYNEACEITAYLCLMYNIDPMGFINYNETEIPTILCHKDAYALGFGSNHGDVLHWFSKFNKTMDNVRSDVAKLIEKSVIVKKPVEKLEQYYVKKDWDDKASDSQKYINLNDAQKACDEAGEEYEVYDSTGVALYPQKPANNKKEKIDIGFNKGDAIKLLPEAVYVNDAPIPSWVFRSKLYIREIRNNGIVAISTQKSGPITGIIAAKYLVPYTSSAAAATTPGFTPYLIRVMESELNVRAGAGTNYRINTQVKKNEVHTIVAENGKWGKLKNGTGWIALKYTSKV